MSNPIVYECPCCGPDAGLIAYKSIQVLVDSSGHPLPDDEQDEEFVEISSPFCRECGEAAEEVKKGENS